VNNRLAIASGAPARCTAKSALTPVFAPDNASLRPADFNTFLDSIETKNGAVAAADSTFSDKTVTPKNLYDLIKERTLRGGNDLGK
jgi:hypothetical protein